MFLGGCCSLGAVAFKVLPGIAVGAVRVGFALWDMIVLCNNVMNDFNNLVGTNADTPTKIFNSVVYTLLPCMADTLQGIAGKGAYAGGFVTLAHVDGICCMAKVETTSELPSLERTNLVARGHRET